MFVIDPQMAYKSNKNTGSSDCQGESVYFLCQNEMVDQRQRHNQGAGDGGDEGDLGGEGRLERGASHCGLHPRGADVSVAEACDSIEAMCLSAVCTLSSSTCMTIPLVTR